MISKPLDQIQVGRFLTQRLVRVKRFEKLIQSQVSGMDSMTLKNNKTSNAFLTDIYTEDQMRTFDSWWLEERTVCGHQPIYGDGSTIEATRSVQIATKEGNRRWRTS
jgi:hypothetical protein